MSVNDFARRLERDSVKEMIDIYRDYVSALYGPYKTQNRSNFEDIKNVIFNPPATIIFWADNTKTVVKCGDDDEYDPEKGLAMAIAKRALGNNGNYYNVFHKWLPKEEDKKPMFDLNKPTTFEFTLEQVGGALNCGFEDALFKIAGIEKKED